MNDIEIFKKLKKNYNTLKKDYNAGHYSVYEMQFEDFEAIENLIQRNKDLEQIEKEHKEENGRLRDKIKELEKIDLTTVYIDGIYDERNKWIINVKEKMNKIKEEDLEISNTDSEDVRIAKYEQRAILDFCEELLEESEK